MCSVLLKNTYPEGVEFHPPIELQQVESGVPLPSEMHELLAGESSPIGNFFREVLPEGVPIIITGSAVTGPLTTFIPRAEDGNFNLEVLGDVDCISPIPLDLEQESGIADTSTAYGQRYDVDGGLEIDLTLANEQFQGYVDLQRKLAMYGYKVVPLSEINPIGERLFQLDQVGVVLHKQGDALKTDFIGDVSVLRTISNVSSREDSHGGLRRSPIRIDMDADSIEYTAFSAIEEGQLTELSTTPEVSVLNSVARAIRHRTSVPRSKFSEASIRSFRSFKDVVLKNQLSYEPRFHEAHATSLESPDQDFIYNIQKQFAKSAYARPHDTFEVFFGMFELEETFGEDFASTLDALSRGDKAPLPNSNGLVSARKMAALGKVREELGYHGEYDWVPFQNAGTGALERVLTASEFTPYEIALTKWCAITEDMYGPINLVEKLPDPKNPNLVWHKNTIAKYPESTSELLAILFTSVGWDPENPEDVEKVNRVGESWKFKKPVKMVRDDTASYDTNVSAEEIIDKMRFLKSAYE